MSAIGDYYKRQNGYHSTYEYVLDQDDLTRAFMDSRNKLKYALLKQSDRQRFLIANSQGLKERFFKMINEDISKATANLQKAVASDLYSYLMTMINGGSLSSSSHSNALGSAIGRALGNAVVDLAGEIWDRIKENDR